MECWPQTPCFTPTTNLLIATRDDHLPRRTNSLRTMTALSTIHYDSSKVCHLQTCCPLDSFISVQWLSSSSPELLRPKEIQPIISFRFMLRLLYTDRMSVTSESWNRATWKTKVSLYTGFGCPRRIEVLHLDISCPIEFSSVNLTYVSTKEVTLWNSVRYLGMKDLENEVFTRNKDMVYTRMAEHSLVQTHGKMSSKQNITNTITNAPVLCTWVKLKVYLIILFALTPPCLVQKNLNGINT